MNQFNANYWDERYVAQKTGWDVGYATTPFVEYFKGIENKALRILIPGCGNGYEGELLFQLGFTNVTLLDYSENAKRNFLKRVPQFPTQQFLVGDFFEITEKFDLILEQTFFCALAPSLRPNYINKMSDLLNPKGRLVGVLFTFPLTEKGPPFGGSIEEYRKLFAKNFEIHKLEPCYNSIPPRLGNEAYISMKKKSN